MSESKQDDEKRYWWKETLKSRLFVTRFESALVGGKLHRDYLVELGFRPNRIFFGYDVVDNEFFECRAAVARKDPFATSLRQPKIPTRPYFLAACRFIARKNLSALVEAFVSYRREVGFENAWDLVICGNGPQENLVRGIVRHHSLEESVHFPGFIGYEDIGDWYGLANAFIHPALREQWGLVVNEACAAGLPILCSHTVGARYDLVKENENGWLFDPRSKEEITGSLVKLHRLDEHTRTLMGKRGQEIVADFTPERFATNLFRAIEAAGAAKDNG